MTMQTPTSPEARKARARLANTVRDDGSLADIAEARNAYRFEALLALMQHTALEIGAYPVGDGRDRFVAALRAITDGAQRALASTAAPSDPE